MDERLGRIEGKIDSIKDELVEIKIGYAIHERRSIANEKAVQVLDEEVRPLLNQVHTMHKLMVYLAGFAAFVYSVLEIRSLLR